MDRGGAHVRHDGGIVRAAVAVAVFAAVCILPPVGQRVIATTDEARFAVLAHDMLARRVWFGAEIRGELYRNKPPLYPWSIVALSRLEGRVTERTAHAPVAIAAIVAAVFTCLLAHALFGGRAGLWAGLIVSTSYGFFEGSQFLLPDMIVLAFETVAVWAFWRSVVGRARRAWLVTFYAAVAFAVFAKGPMGLVPFLVVGAWLWTEHGRRGLGALWSPAGALVFAAITAGWLVPYLGQGGRGFTGTVVMRDWLAWYLGPPSASRFEVVALDVLGGLLPWTPLLLLPFARIRRDWKDPAARFAFLALAVPLAVALAALHHRTRYLLPIYPGAALLLAGWADTEPTITDRLVRFVRWVAPAGGIGLAVAVVARWLVPSGAELASDVGGTGLAEAASGAVIAACGVVIAVVMWRSVGRHRTRALVIPTAIIAAVALETGIWAYDAWTDRVHDFGAAADRIEQHAHGGEVAIFGDGYLSIDFYLGRALTRLPSTDDLREHLARPDRPVVVVTAAAWPRVEHVLPAGVRAIDTVRVRDRDMILLQRVAG